MGMEEQDGDRDRSPFAFPILVAEFSAYHLVEAYRNGPDSEAMSFYSTMLEGASPVPPYARVNAQCTGSTLWGI